MHPGATAYTHRLMLNSLRAPPSFVCLLQQLSHINLVRAYPSLSKLYIESRLVSLLPCRTYSRHLLHINLAVCTFAILELVQ
jgi:hypothetical protein